MLNIILLAALALALIVFIWSVRELRKILRKR